MGATTDEQFQAVGDFSFDLDHNLEVYDELVDAQKRPRKVHVLVYDEDDTLIYVGVLLSVTGDKAGLTIGGSGLLWHLGQGDIGPMITSREYVSGNNKLSNPSFDLLDENGEAMYWVRPSEESLWVMAGGNATNAGGYESDDVFDSDEEFPAIAGQQYRAVASGVTGTGRLRLRTIYGGKFDPPNLLTNPSFESGPGVGWIDSTYVAVSAAGARTGDHAMRASPIPKPQLISNSDFSTGATDWTLGSTFSIAGGRLIASANPKPQYISDTGFETGTGWTAVTTPAPMSADITLVNNPAEAQAGSWVMKVGPVTQHQVFLNSDFETAGLLNWYPSSEDATPDPGLFYEDVGGGLDGSKAATTDGAAFPTRAFRYLRADNASGTAGVQAYDVKPGERYTYEVYVRAAPSTNGSAYVSLHIPHPTIANRERWYISSVLDGAKVSDDVFRRAYIDLSIPANRFKVDALCEVHDCTTGFWAFDNATMIRTRGNKAELALSTPIPVVANNNYELAALLRQDNDMQVGTVRLGVTLFGAAVPLRTIDRAQGSTDATWTNVPVSVRVPEGYTHATPFVAGLDIIGEPAWIDNMTFTKVDGNTDVTTHAPFAVAQDQTYTLSADVEIIGATKGTVTVGVTLSGAGVSDMDVPVSLDVKGGTGVKAISTDVIPGEGYTTATPYVRSTDIESGTFAIDHVRLVKVDNNFDSSVGATIGVIPLRTYEWSVYVKSGLGYHNGTVHLSARCTRTGYPDEIVTSGAVGNTAAEEGGTPEWELLSFSFTPPSGYEFVIPTIIATDIEGDFMWIDDGDVRDMDKETMVFDAVSVNNPADVSFFRESTAPAGTRTVRTALIVETGTSGWTVEEMSLARIGVTFATGNAVIADFLKDPDTDVTLSLTAGTIATLPIIPHDWIIKNTTNRVAFEHYVSVVAIPALEFKVNVDRTVDVGVPEDVFADRTEVVLLLKDTDVQDISNAQSNVENRATKIHLIGVERETYSGHPFLIEAWSIVPGTPELDWNQNPISRTHTVNAGTVDHMGYAQAYADDLAAKEAEPAIALTATLTGVNTRPAFDVGDWIYAYEPEAGLADETNPVPINGKTVFPRKVRVLSRTRNLGPTHRVEIRRTDGTTFDLSDMTMIDWEKADSTTLTIGDRVVDWEVDDQGGPESGQYMNDRARKPRP